MDMSPLMEMTGITKSFVGVRALEGVNFSCDAGEVHVLLGENGAGKSTLLKILTGVYQMDAGGIRLRGEEVRFHNTAQSRRAGVSMVYQELSVLPHLTVAQNVFLGSERKNGLVRGGITRESRMRREVEALAGRYGIQVDPYAVAGDLPVAKQQMVEILKVLVQDPDIIILDEPTSSIAREEVDKLYEIVTHLKEEGKTVIFISHRLEEVFRFGDRATVLKDGRTVDTIRLAEHTEEDLVRMMVGRELSDIFPPKCPEPGERVFSVRGLTISGLLHDISFDVNAGEIVGIAGLQGHGQTELLSAIAGVLDRERGELVLRDRTLRVKNPAGGIRERIAYLPEDRKVQGLMLGLSIRDNLSITSLRRRVRLAGRIDRAAEDAFVAESIQRMRIKTPNARQPVERLSGGNQQKVVLGKCLATQPDVLLFNEPTRGIDVGTKQEFYRMMRAFAGEGVAVVMYSSDLLEVVGLSDRVLAMYEGRVTCEITGDDITEERIMLAAMGVDGGGA